MIIIILNFWKTTLSSWAVGQVALSLDMVVQGREWEWLERGRRGVLNHSLKHLKDENSALDAQSSVCSVSALSLRSRPEEKVGLRSSLHGLRRRPENRFFLRLCSTRGRVRLTRPPSAAGGFRPRYFLSAPGTPMVCSELLV